MQSIQHPLPAFTYSQRSLPTASLSTAEPTGFPPCPRDCSNRGVCSHIGVCSCRRGWGGDDCSKPRCPERCSGHGKCLLSDLAAACVCDEGYAGYDCAAQPPPPFSPPPAAVASPAPPFIAAPSPPPLALRLNVTARNSLYTKQPVHGMPLSPLLPQGAQSLYWAVGGLAPRVLRFESAAGSLKLEAVNGLAEKEAVSRLNRQSLSGVLQAEVGPAADEGAPASARVLASTADYLSSRAYTALSSGGTTSVLLQLELPTLHVLSTFTPPYAYGMGAITCMTLGGGATESTVPPTYLHVLRGSFIDGKTAELLVLRLPEMRPSHSMRFAVPGPVVASHYDARSGILFLLSGQPKPKLMRIMMNGGQPAGPPGLGDTMPLSDWGHAAPFLLPYPRSRQLVFFSAMPEGGYNTPPSPPPSSNATLLPGGYHYPITKESPWLLHVCRIRMDAPPPLASELDGCTQLRGQSATEEILAAVADEVSGSAYLGCKSGTALRLSLKPVRVEERVAAGSPITGALLRPQDGTLWLSSEGGELLQLSTRQAAGTASQASATSGTPQPTWFRWARLPFSKAAGGADDAPSPPYSPPPLMPSPPPVAEDFGVEPLIQHAKYFWAYHKLGYGPALVLALIGACCGGMIGGRLYRLFQTIRRPRKPAAGFAQLP